MQFLLCQNLELRQTLIQKLGLESKYLESFLVRSETFLRTRDGQRGVALVRHLADEDRYRSVLDFLVGLFVPSMKPAIFAFYNDDGPKLGEEFDFQFIDNLDQRMVQALDELRGLAIEMKLLELNDRTSRTELTATEVDLILRPQFPTVVTQAERKQWKRWVERGGAIEKLPYFGDHFPGPIVINPLIDPDD